MWQKGDDRRNSGVHGRPLEMIGFEQYRETESENKRILRDHRMILKGS